MTDLRKGVLVQSEDLGEELLSGAIVGGKFVVGGERGVIRMWQQGVWDQAEEKVVVGRGESLDVLSAVAEGVGGMGDMVAVGVGDGQIKFVDIGKRNVVAKVIHDEVDGLTGLGFDIDGRMISGGGQTIKVWQENSVERDEDEEDYMDAGHQLTNINEDDSEDEASEADQGGNHDEETKSTKRRKREKHNQRISKGDGSDVPFKDMD